MELVLIGCLMLAYWLVAGPAAQPIDEVPVNIEEAMQEVLKPEEILLSEAM